MPRSQQRRKHVCNAQTLRSKVSSSEALESGAGLPSESMKVACGGFRDLNVLKTALQNPGLI